MNNLEYSMGQIQHDSISDVVVGMLRKYILENKLTSGDKLPTETRLSEVLGVSRASIREAMKILEGYGVISTIHGKGRFIRDFNYDQMLDNLSYNLHVHFNDFYEIVQVRKGLETYFLPRAAQLMNEADFEDLENLLQKMEQESNAGLSDSDLVSTHTQFHNRLYKSIQNKLLDSLISMFATFQRILTASQHYKKQDNKEFLCKHRNLLLALKSKDIENITNCLQEHFSDFESYSNR
jgi:GntR family transcriptional repressor for pyruvate dehydrogenase complex